MGKIMANYNAKGKQCKYGEKAKNTTFKLYSWEIEKVRAFIKQMRAEYNNSYPSPKVGRIY